MEMVFTAFASPPDKLGLRGDLTGVRGQVPEILSFIVGAGFAACVAAILLLGWLLSRERGARRAAEAALAAERAAAAEQAARLELLDRRRAAIAPIESLWLAWSGGSRPGEALIIEAARGIAEARLLFGNPLEAELDEAALLLAEHVRGRSWQRDAVQAGRRDESADLIDAEIARERALKPLIAALRARLAEAARPA